MLRGFKREIFLFVLLLEMNSLRNLYKVHAVQNFLDDPYFQFIIAIFLAVLLSKFQFYNHSNVQRTISPIAQITQFLIRRPTPSNFASLPTISGPHPPKNALQMRLHLEQHVHLSTFFSLLMYKTRGFGLRRSLTGFPC